MDELLNFYIYQRGWLIMLLLPALIFIVMMVDNARNARGGVGWVAAVFLCLMLFLPAALHDLGPNETRQSLAQSREIMLYIGILGLIVPFMLLFGYWLSNRAPAMPYQNVPISQDMTQLGPSPASDNVPRVTPNQITGVDENMPGVSAPMPYGGAPMPYGGAPMPYGGAPMPYGGMPASAPLEASTQINPNKGSAAFTNEFVFAWLEDVKTGAKYQLRRDKNSIGRGEQHQINLTDNTVSRQGHALVLVDGKTVIVKNTATSSTVMVNNVPVTYPVNMVHGDVLTVGDVQLRLIWGEGK